MTASLDSSFGPSTTSMGENQYNTEHRPSGALVPPTGWTTVPVLYQYSTVPQRFTPYTM
jgi:hypothetical protein